MATLPQDPGPINPDECDLAAMLADRPRDDDEPTVLDLDDDPPPAEPPATYAGMTFADWLEDIAAVMASIDTPGYTFLAGHVVKLAKEARVLGATCPGEYDARVDAMTAMGS